MNRLRKEIRERSTPTQNFKNNKMRIDINEFNLYSDKEKKISRKYKISLVNNIKSLNADQIKGVINIIHDNLNVDEKTMEFDVNNLPVEKLRELDKYVKKCLKIRKSKKCGDTQGVSVNQGYNQNIHQQSTNTKIGDNINVNININNNFMMEMGLTGIKNQNSFNSNTIEDNNLKKKNSILSDSDSLSSDEDSGKIQGQIFLSLFL